MRPLVLTAFLLLVAAPAAAEAPTTPAPVSPLAHHGFITDRNTAEHAIAFTPFLPDPDPVAVALEPAFHGDQLSKNEGIAYAYVRHGRTWIVSEWPRNGGSLDAWAPLDVGGVTCGEVHAIGKSTAPRGVVWATPHGLVMSLVPDGYADGRTVLGEWRRLARRGACR